MVSVSKNRVELACVDSAISVGAIYVDGRYMDSNIVFPLRGTDRESV